MFGSEKDSTIFGVWNNAMYISTEESPGKVFYNDVWKLVKISY